MGGGLLQLVAYGAQDAYLSGNPQITFFKGLFKRHTNFAMEPFRVNFTGQAAWGTKQSAVMGRHADLMYSTYLEVVLDAGYYNGDGARLGYNLLQYVELEIGGQVIDRQYGEFLFLWDSLTSDAVQGSKLTEMVNGFAGSGSDGPIYLGGEVNCNNGSGRPSLPNTILYIPFFFWYTRSPGAALPLIALQYHEVRINMLWNDAKSIAGDFNKLNLVPQPIQAAIYVDYIYLDTEERRRMAQQSHEYLIEQTQYNEDKGISSYNNRIDLTFNHPVKELIWVVQPAWYTDCKLAAANNDAAVYRGVTNTTIQTALFNVTSFAGNYTSVTLVYGGSGYTPGPQSLTISGGRLGGSPTTNDLTFSVVVNAAGTIESVDQSSLSGTPVTSTANTRLKPFTYDQAAVYEQWIQINGQDRMDKRYGDYFNKVQPYQHHTGALRGPGSYMYSFALRPEEHQPSGTCNFSRIDTATIVMTISGDVLMNQDLDNTLNVRVYAINYNILRVMSGMGGLAYSN
jgi:hypothetical protein